MTKLNEIYKCEICGNVVEITHTGAGDLVCCGQPMAEQAENKVDAATEKHIPIIEENDSGILIKVGEVDHPMDPDHFIEWIEIENNRKVYRKYLKPGNKAEAQFCINPEDLKARAYCNLHGLWTS